jgi:hypothetical protein
MFAMKVRSYPERVRRCVALIADAGLDALLLTKPSNTLYLASDGRPSRLSHGRPFTQLRNGG